MSVGGMIAAARVAHARLMIDTCLIERGTRGDLDAALGVYTATWATVYDGPCRVKGPRAGQANAIERQAGAAEQTTNRQTIVLPHGAAADATVGDRVTITAGHTTGAVYAIVGDVDATSMSARSLLVEAVEDPASHLLSPWIVGGGHLGVDTTVGGAADWPTP